MSYAKTEEIIQKSRETLEITKDNRDYSTGFRATEKIIKKTSETAEIIIFFSETPEITK